MFLRLLACLGACLLALTGLHAAEARRAALAATAMRPAPPSTAAVAAVTPGGFPARVNVNTAPLELLVTLKGIGEKKARAILAFRREHGPFNSLEQFEEVPGIGPALIEQNRSRIVFR